MATLIFLASCSPKTEYTNALPKNASIVMALDLDAMADKGGLKDEDGKPIIEKVKTMLKSGLEGDAALLAEKIVANPIESGLQLADKVYLFATPHATAFAVLAKVEDTSKLEKLLEVLHKEQIASEIKDESGCRWAEVGQAVCAFNNGTFLLMQHAKGDASSIKGTLFSLMRQQEGEGYASLPEFARIKAEGNDVAAIADLSVVPQEWTAPLRMGLSGSVQLQDIKYFMSTNFEKGRVILQTESISTQPAVVAFFESMNNATSPIDGKNLDLYPGSTFAWMGGKVHGRTLYDMLCQNPSIRKTFNNPILPVDVERIFASVEGDFSIGLSSLNGGDFLAYADVTNKDFLQTFEELRPLLALTGGQVKLHDTAEGEYALQTYDAVYWFGVKGNRFYVTNRKQLAEEANRTYGASLANRPWKEEALKNRIFASFHLDDMGIPVVMMVEDIIIGIPQWEKLNMELIMKDKEENALRTLVQMLGNMER